MSREEQRKEELKKQAAEIHRAAAEEEQGDNDDDDLASAIAALTLDIDQKIATALEEKTQLENAKQDEDTAEWVDSDPDPANSEETPDEWDIDSEEERRKETKAEARRQAKLAKKEAAMANQADKEKARVRRLGEVEKLLKQLRLDLDQGKKKLEAEQAEAEKKAMAKKMEGQLRSPIVCILGHVDTGKTKLLDKIRATNVQDNEAGGITQQIGATYFPMDRIREKTALLSAELKKELAVKLPGLLIIDTPGHESFTNLRSRGSSLCDIAILVVDIMHGLEPQTLESIELLRKRKTPFIVALNKVDRLYNWKAKPDYPFFVSLKDQHKDTQGEFETRVQRTVTLFAEKGLNTCLYSKNKDFRKWISLVPTSAHTGEGIPDLLMLITQLTQKMMGEQLMYLSGLQCTVLEVKQVEGLGTTIDVVLVNGVLHESDTLVVCGLQGPIVTSVRALLTPHPMKEIRVKGEYLKHKTVKAAMGIKIVAPGLEHAIAGSNLLVCRPQDDIEDLKDEVMADLQNVLSRIDKSGVGVYVQASTLGSLEALLSFLKDMKIPVSGISIGPVHKKDVMKAAVMLEHKKEFALILAFDVAVSKDARNLAASMGVEIFTADIIYHLFDQCTAHMEKKRQEARAASAGTAVFPCVLEIMPQYIFNKKDPIVLGCKVVEGILRLETPVCVPDKEALVIGRVGGIQKEHKDVLEAKAGDEVAVKFLQDKEGGGVMFGRQFDEHNQLASLLTRKSIDLLKENFKDDLKQDDWRLVIKLKKMYGIV